MSGHRDQNCHKAANFPKKILPVFIDDAVSLTDAVVFSYAPGYRFQVTRVRSFCRTKAGTITAKVKVGTRVAVTTVTFTAATEVAQTLSTALANLRGSSSEALTIELTSDGTGALTNGFVSVEIRPWPLNADLGPST